MKRIAIYYIATSNYKMGFEHFKKDIHYFYPNDDKTIIILSDGLNEWDGVKEGNVTYKVHHIEHFPWPIITLFKMKYILDFWDDSVDYVCYFNGNLQYNKDFDVISSKIDLSKLNVSRHCKRNKNIEFDGKPSSNNSCSCIRHPYKYIHAGFFIGKSDIVKKMCMDVCRMTENDLAKNIIPKWHDESYLNKWCEDNPHLVNKDDFIKYAEFHPLYPVSIIETILKDRRTDKRIYN
jgi:hypothetical protein